MSITKRGDTENLGQSCDRQLTQGSYSGLSPLLHSVIYSEEEEGESTPDHGQSDVHVHPPIPGSTLQTQHRG